VEGGIVDQRGNDPSLGYTLLGRLRLFQRMDPRMITQFKVRLSLRTYREMGIRTRVEGGMRQFMRLVTFLGCHVSLVFFWDTKMSDIKRAREIRLVYPMCLELNVYI
jgi:hypothetical protein